MSDNVVLREDRGPVRILTMNRPDKLNAFNADMHRGLAASMARAESDPAVRCVLVTGAGRVVQVVEEVLL